MDNGPFIPKRVGSGSPPSGLPDSNPSYPGKPLAHRYIPTQNPRVSVIEDNNLPTLASPSAFSHISTISHEGKDAYLGSISNSEPRKINLPRQALVNIPRTPEPALTLHENIYKPLEARVQNISRDATNNAVSTAASTVISAPSVSNTPASTTAQIVSDIASLKSGFTEKPDQAQKSSPIEPRSSQSNGTSLADVSRTFTDREEFKGDNLEIKKEEIPTENNAKLDAGAQQLLDQAEQLEKELSKLREGIAVTQRQSEEEISKAENYQAQVAQLSGERANLSGKINELTAAHNHELSQRKSLEQKLQEIVGSYEQKLKIAAEEKAQILARERDQSEKLATFELKLRQTEEAFQNKLGQLTLEKNSLLEELGKLKLRSGGPTPEQIAILKKESEELQVIKSQLEQVVQERNALQEKSVDLAKVVNTLKTKPEEPSITNSHPKQESPQINDEVMSKTIPLATPAPNTAVRVVKPQPAVGKMAPVLTNSPNVVNGVIKDVSGMLLPSIIIVVKDATNTPVRALKSNKIGQFAISTPLPNGTYTMELESDEHSFDVIQIDVEGKVMPPIEIRAHN